MNYVLEASEENAVVALSTCFQTPCLCTRCAADDTLFALDVASEPSTRSVCRRVKSSYLASRTTLAIGLIAILFSGCAGGGLSLRGASSSITTVPQLREGADLDAPEALSFATQVTRPEPSGMLPDASLAALFTAQTPPVETVARSFASTAVSKTMINGMILTEYSVPTFRDALHGGTLYPSPTGITAGSDGALWFTDFLSGSIWRITTSGVLTVFPLPNTAENAAIYAEPKNITMGQDGALWFTESQNSRIGRITTSGVLTEFPLQANGLGVNTGPQGIAIGPLGAIWFTQPKYSQTHTAIGWLTPNGAVSEFAIAKNYASPFPNQIVLGPDNAFWFTNINSIGRLSRAGKFSEYPVSFVGKSPFGSGVEGITVGPNAALWFTELHGNRLGCVTTAGTVTQFPVIPTAESNPFYLTEGPDGALWFTEENAGKVGRMTMSGSFTEFPLPDSQAKPMGITVGPDGALWFAESDQSDAKIGRLSFP